MKIDILDKGYIRLVDTLGDDLSVVNAARVSYDKESQELSENDNKLLKFLWENNHTSPFRHAALTFEVYVPLMVARQHWKHVVASSHIDDLSGWNESSRRYITEKEEFYIPKISKWRSAPENSKQGSGEDMDFYLGHYFTNELITHIEKSIELYSIALKRGMAPEMARLFLPAYGMYVRYRWTASLHAVMNFLQQRLEHDAQKEIQELAIAVREITKNKFPESLNLL
jgi:thymidylate synthase (FAD)